jgi:hypothetical protein
MDLEKLFEEIYDECNTVESENYLEWPLDTESKPPMLFEQIYLECNLKSLFERVLREVLQDATSDDVKNAHKAIKGDKNARYLYSKGTRPKTDKQVDRMVDAYLQPQSHEKGTLQHIPKKSVDSKGNQVGIFEYCKVTWNDGSPPDINNIKFFSTMKNGNITLLEDAISELLNFFKRDNAYTVGWSADIRNSATSSYYAINNLFGGNPPQTDTKNKKLISFIITSGGFYRSPASQMTAREILIKINKMRKTNSNE